MNKFVLSRREGVVQVDRYGPRKFGWMARTRHVQIEKRQQEQQSNEGRLREGVETRSLAVDATRWEVS